MNPKSGGIHVPPMPNWARLLASGITGGVAGVVIPAVLGGPIVFLLESVGLSLSLEGTGILIGCIGFGGTWYGLGRRYCRRRTELDWHAGTYALQIGTRSSNGSLEKIQAFVVKGYRHKGDDDSPTTYDCKLIVDLDDGRETIFWTDKKTDRENVYRQAGSMAEDLADALGIEWKWKGFE